MFETECDTLSVHVLKGVVQCILYSIVVLRYWRMEVFLLDPTWTNKTVTGVKRSFSGIYYVESRLAYQYVATLYL